MSGGAGLISSASREATLDFEHFYLVFVHYRVQVPPYPVQLSAYETRDILFVNLHSFLYVNQVFSCYSFSCLDRYPL